MPRFFMSASRNSVESAPRAILAALHAPHKIMEKIRLSKRMSELGLCSRREADVYIEKGWVEVDGVPVSQLGSKVTAAQKVTLRTPAQNSQQERVTIIMNKPIAYVSGKQNMVTNPPVCCSMKARAGRTILRHIVFIAANIWV